jgi:hypothetical protein
MAIGLDQFPTWAGIWVGLCYRRDNFGLCVAADIGPNRIYSDSGGLGIAVDRRSREDPLTNFAQVYCCSLFDRAHFTSG